MSSKQMEIEITLEDVLGFLHQKQNQEIEGTKNFLEYGPSYLLACHKDNVPAHWFCSEEFVEITTELLHLFALDYTNEQIEEFKNVMVDQLYLNVFENTTAVNALFDVTIKTWDRCRVYNALQKLKQHLENPTSDILKLNSVTAILSEIMFNPSLLIDRLISSLYIDLILSIPQNHLKQMYKGFLPGMIILSVYENDDLRQLFWKIMQGFQLEGLVKLEDFDVYGYYDLLQSVIRYLKDWDDKSFHFQEYSFTKNLKIYWGGLRRILCNLDSSTIIFRLCHEPIGICDLVVTTIYNQDQLGSEFVEIIKCLQVLLRTIKAEFWNHTSLSSQGLLIKIFKSTTFRKAVDSHPEKCALLLEWVLALVESSISIVPILLKYLLYSFQKTSWPCELALESLDVALKVLKRHDLKIDSTLSSELKSVISNENKMFHRVLLKSQCLSFVNEMLSLNAVPYQMPALNNSTFSTPSILDSESSESSELFLRNKPQSTAFKPSNKRKPISMNMPSKRLSVKKGGTISKMRDKFVKERQNLASELKTSNQKSNTISDTQSPINLMEFNDVQPKPIQPSRQTKLINLSDVISHHRARQDNKQQDRVVQLQKIKEDMRRLRPNLKSLHKKVLTWNMNSTGDRPPNIINDKYKHIPDHFKKVEEYIDIFEPLLILELWQNFISAKEEIDDSDSYVITIDSSVSVDDFIEVECHSIDSGQLKSLSENDLIMIKPADNGKGSFSNFTKPINFLAIVKSISFNKLNVQCYFNDDPLNLRGQLRPQSSWTIKKVIRYGNFISDFFVLHLHILITFMINYSLTTTAREYAALMASPYFKFINLIMRPKHLTYLQCPRAQLERYTEIYRINESQAEAVWKVLNNKDNISLIQGPPGTGKTSTIVSIISELRSIPDVYRSQILTCAPSNAAVDEIEKRLQGGIYDSDGKLIKINVVRFGKFDSSTDEETSDPKIQGNKNEKSQQIIKKLQEADVICATLTGSGHDMLADFTFQAVIIDEAAQAIELTSLIPMKFNPIWCVLVGDSNQLPPTVLSKVATDYFYEQSLFSRIQRGVPDLVHMLKTQYRMHPEICQGPSKLFYGSQLQNAIGLEKLRTQVWHAKPIFTPYRFFDVLGTMGRDQNSFYNKEEANTAARLVSMLTKNFPEIDFKDRIGVITPYKRQLSEIKRLFAQKIPDDLYKKIEFNTVDGFQGKEKDIIVFSCVRAKRKNNIGFLKDIRRMNVALTRAKSSLFILGNRQTLEKDPHWKELIDDAVQRKLYTRCFKYLAVTFRDTIDISRENSDGYEVNNIVNEGNNYEG
ncbi:8599_t:CDS:2 [Scutellospora calospora]|uniref:8599_t:CDS:1 n=1 Tax=Scutellospora calospora TaxID=85575 RepID=A0ACA9JU58_9GLOM|nr:8599_t:CDS:2 [Scutellospora calospora]